MIICSCLSVRFSSPRCSHYVNKAREVTKCKRRGKYKYKSQFYCQFHFHQINEGILKPASPESSGELSFTQSTVKINLRKSHDDESVASSSQGSNENPG